MTMTVETAQLNNQSILQNFGLVEELDEQAAEIISGGYERFTIKNSTNNRISYTVDGVQSAIKPGQEQTISTNMGGKIIFDSDDRNEVINVKGYNLSDSGKYEFIPDRNTKNPSDFNLYLRR